MTEIEKLILKDDVRSWFYYHHRTTNFAKPMHEKHIQCLSSLSYVTDTHWVDDDPTWAQIRVAINKLFGKEMYHLYNLQRSKD